MQNTDPTPSSVINHVDADHYFIFDVLEDLHLRCFRRPGKFVFPSLAWDIVALVSQNPERMLILLIKVSYFYVHKKTVLYFCQRKHCSYFLADYAYTTGLFGI